MTSAKLLLALMAAPALAAPQINERQVVADVLAQLQPSIQRALASIGSSSAPAPSGFASSSFSAPAPTRFTSSSFSAPTPISFSAPAPTAFTSAPRFTSNSGTSVTSLTSTVVSQLQPSIAAAVAAALRSSSRGSSSVSTQPEYPSTPASYNYDYKVADDDSQSYIAHQESREGEDVTGSYNYVDPTGSLVTVTYKAGPLGFSQERSVEAGAVVMRDVPVGYSGPLAGVDDLPGGAGVIATSRVASPGQSQADLIAQILAALQPRISSAVQSAISSSSTRWTVPLPVVRIAPVIAPVQDNDSIIRSIISSLQPTISSAVSSAISSTSSRSSGSSSGSSSSTGGNLVSRFGAPGGSSVRVETPSFTYST